MNLTKMSKAEEYMQFYTIKPQNKPKIRLYYLFAGKTTMKARRRWLPSQVQGDL
jgi:hypothetical protein